MPIYIQNSLSRRKEPFEPTKPPQVNMYTCGVTVYDDCHIGHARSLYIFDVIRRYLVYRGFKVNFVRNITDIDDKIINRANELKVSWEDLVAKYIQRYYEDIEVLGISRADFEPRATENIPDMIKYIQALIERGFAYESGGDVYFNVRKFSGYGKLSGQSIDAMESGTRIEPTEHKKDPLDFALWKKSKENEPFWESPWGNGRPGWHIECSVMSQKYLKVDTLDIHAGGRDLIFPHHENEIAQAEALTGKPFAKYWIHHGLLTINSQKMSKSLGNFVTITDFLSKHRYADILKLFFLSAHYSHPIDYSEEKITEVKQALERILIFLDKAQNLAASKKAGQFQDLENLKQEFIKAMDDDFNLPQGLAVIFELVNAGNKKLDDANYAFCARAILLELAGILGLELHREAMHEDVDDLINQRNEARKNKNFKESDRIRKELELKGIVLEDTKDGKTTWRKKL
ncbi:MAG: cysteine--tRNA ligase [Candidatus Omnitrophica bacterium]|nr:cysteine--tRNA ligase [Candidatus Omnitrophota bacterium]